MMDFSSALIHLKNGKCVTRISWNSTAYWKLGGKYIAQFHYYAGKKTEEVRRSIYDDEILAEDWEVVEVNEELDKLWLSLCKKSYDENNAAIMKEMRAKHKEKFNASKLV